MISNILSNKKTHYGAIHVLLHWAMAGIVFFLFGSGLYMVTLTYYDAGYVTWPRWHKAVGVIFFALLLLRIVWLIVQPKPRPLKTHARWEVILAHATHGMMYLLMLVMGVTGYLIATARGSQIDFFGLFNIAPLINADANSVMLGKIHLFAAVSLMALVGLHALGALKHAIFDRDGTLKRMFGIAPKISF